jgi:hypothetical protein
MRACCLVAALLPRVALCYFCAVLLRAYGVHKDGTIYGPDGKVLHFSTQRFVDEVVKAGHCFICGRAQSAEVPFNDEHIVPKWVLRRFGLFDKRVELPNGATVPYRSYTVPCCVECNSELGEKVETPVSNLLSGTHEELMARVDEQSMKLVHCWMALLFLKMLLKDMSYRWHLDRREGDMKIGDHHYWEGFHHIQCLARTPVIGAELDLDACGTIFFRQALTAEGAEGGYDYGDHTMGRTVFVRVGDTYVFTVLNDAGMTQQIVAEFFDKVGLLAPPQARELHTYLAYMSLRLSKRPSFSTRMNPQNGNLQVVSEAPKTYTVTEGNQELFGHMLHFALSGYLDGAESQVIERVKAGQWSCVFDMNNDFIRFDRAGSEPVQP